MIKPVENDVLSDGYDKRYVMVNTETGEIIDDAMGSGFRSEKKAVRCWRFKNSPEGRAKMQMEKEERRKNREARMKAIREQKDAKKRISQKRKTEEQKNA